MSYIIANTYDKNCIIQSTDKEYVKTILTMRRFSFYLILGKCHRPSQLRFKSVRRNPRSVPFSPVSPLRRDKRGIKHPGKCLVEIC